MHLEPEQRRLLGRAQIGMLALRGSGSPLVNPAAFHFGGGALWMTTSRHAAKVALVRRDPRAAFLVSPPEEDGHSLLLQGLLEVYDPFSLPSHLRAMAQGPGFALNLAGYALKNAAFVGGYLLDLLRVPLAWWPQNRVLLRMRPDHVRLVPALVPPPAAPARLPGVPSELALSVARSRVGQLCWLLAGRPVLANVAWALDGHEVLVWLPPVPRPPRAGAPGTLVVERHRLRSTQARGVALQGRLAPDASARGTLAARYEKGLPEGGTVLRLAARRVTWWRGFEVGRARLRRARARGMRSMEAWPEGVAHR
ncbi:MAG TPA: pyridoxamine 5'-phosphate oxidase family protein [Candidatus Dormibacteraeota bacterium]|nr:pyridoxamine 5'-phosphate oxidase family protein [Candidatus Dormibacteraeota bacterium]